MAEYVGGSNKGGGRVTFIPPSTVINESFFTDEDQTSSNGLTAFPLCFVFRFIPVSPKPYCNSCSNVPKVIPVTHVGCHVEDADEYDKGDVARPARARSAAASRRTGKSTVEFTGRVGQTSTPFHTLADWPKARGHGF